MEIDEPAELSAATMREPAMLIRGANRLFGFSSIF